MATHDIAILHVPDRQRETTQASARVVTLPWHRMALGAILLLAAVLNSWDLARLGYGNDYYAAAVRSMMQSWHNFFFNAFDPGGFVTIDKPPLGFWFQVISAKLFGYNGISLLLPSLLAGILSVWLLYYLVGRVFGRGAGLLAALAMAVAPVAVASNRSNIIDSILVFFMLLAAWAMGRAAARGSMRWLLLCAVLVGLGFNIKMLEAYLVVPALGIVYLLGAPIAWWKRLVHLVLAGVVMLAVSLSWAVAVDLTPASQRPWVDSTTTNSELDLAIGYNGLQRLTGQGGPGGSGGRSPGGFPGAGRFDPSGVPLGSASGSGAAAGNSAEGGTPSGSGTGSTPSQQGGGPQPSQGGASTGATQGRGATTAGSGASPFAGGSPPGGRGGGPGGGPGGGGMFGTGQAGPWRLFGQGLGGQISWLLPLALFGLLAAAACRRVRLPLDRRQQGVLLWGAWLLTVAGFFSVAGFFHQYYLVTLAPPVAALTGIGVATLWQRYRERHWLGWLLPLALLATAAAQVAPLQPYPDWSRWLEPPVLGLSIAGALLLVLARLRRLHSLRRWAPFAAGVGVLALLVAPTAWAAGTAASGGGGMTPSAGPSGSSLSGFGGGGNGFRGGGPRGGGVSPAGQNAGPGGPGGDATANNGLLSYLEEHQGTTKYLVAVQDSNNAAAYIIQTGKPVMSLGGFSGNDPILTLDGLKALIKNNTVRYFSGVGSRGSDNGIATWVQSACTAVPASAYGGSNITSSSGQVPGAGGPGTGAPGGFRGNGQELYDCAGAVK